MIDINNIINILFIMILYGFFYIYLKRITNYDDTQISTQMHIQQINIKKKNKKIIYDFDDIKYLNNDDPIMF